MKPPNLTAILLSCLLLGSGLVGAQEAERVPGQSHGRSEGSADPDKARCEALNKEVIKLHDAGKYAEAARLAEELLPLAERAYGADSLYYAGRLNDLAVQYYWMGEYAKAESLYKKALDIQRRALGETHPEYANTLNNLAAFYYSTGDYVQAESLLKQAMEIKLKTVGQGHPDYAMVLSNLSALYHLMGDYAKAESLRKQAMQIDRRSFGENHPKYAQDLSSLALLYKSLGDCAKAESLYKQVVEITLKALGENHPDYALSLHNLAALYREMGDYKKAEPLCKQVLEMERKTTGENHPSYATSLNNLALLYQSMGEYAKAEPLLKRAADIDRKALGEDHMEYARSLSNLALVYESMNEYAKAESLHKKTLEIRLKALGENHPDSATSLNNLAHLYAAWDKPVEALEFFNSGMKSLHSHALKVLAGLSEERKLEFLHQVWPKFEAYLTFILDHPNASGSLASGALWLARWKALSAEVQTEQYRMLRVVNDTETRRILEQLESARRDLARWTLSPPLKMKPEDIRVRREQKEAKMAELEDALAKKSAEFAELRKLGSADLAQIAQALPENGALLDFACFRQFNFKAKTRQAKWGDYRYILFITPSRSTLHASRSTDQVVLVDLGPAKPVDDAVVAFRSAVEPRPYELRITDYESRITQPLKTLSNLVLTPILPHIKDKKHLIICPDGQLSLVPFECLLTDDRKYLLESVHISYLSAGREAVAYGGIETVLAQQAAPLLLGDPDFDVPLVIHRRRGALHRAEATPPAGSALSRAEEWPLQALRASRDLGAARFPGLPGTRSEVELAAKMIGGKVLIERSATESAVKQASRPDLLYLATHGFFLADQEVNPEKSLGKVRGVTVGDESQPVPRLRIENPLLRCGLALAGANNRDTVSPDSWADDGILTGMEVAGLDLRGTKLVVLSACETGIGDVRQGEGVMGLRRAFLLAGAKRVLATLWKVPDDQTQELMTDFVKRWQAGSPPAEALREAQLGMIERLRKERGQAHPFFWAAFTMTGDWR